jgi:hypothetical protein
LTFLNNTNPSYDCEIYPNLEKDGSLENRYLSINEHERNDRISARMIVGQYQKYVTPIGRE